MKTMFKETVNVSSLKTAHTLLANLSDDEAIQVQHRGSKTKVIITEANYRKLITPKSVLQIDNLPHELDFVPNPYHNMNPKDDELHDVRCLGINVAVGASMIPIRKEFMTEFKAQAASQLSTVLNDLNAQGKVFGFLSAPILGFQPHITSTMLEYYVFSCVMMPKGTDLGEYAQYEFKEDGAPSVYAQYKDLVP